MTLKTSLFNTGIYKSTVKRNIWGAVIYFILLFLMTSMPLISEIDSNAAYLFNSKVPTIYRNSFIAPALIVSIIAPTIVAMLVFRFVHSKKTAVFVHSLPVNRTANYISTLAAAFTLMAAPVVANGVVLMALSVTAYSGCFSVLHCLGWIGVNILCQFVMFSLAAFAAMITGNTIATAVLNILLHVFPIIITACISIICENFLFGYPSDDALLSVLASSNPAAWVYSLGTQMGYENSLNIDLLVSRIPWYVAGSVVLYAAAWLLYKKRAMEKCEDVAAFGVLNPIFKYFATFLTALAVYAVFNTFFYEHIAMFVAILVLLSAVAYFASEMLLKKTLKVWNTYKGYLGFGCVFAFMICIFAFTSFFGYELRVPDAADIESAALYNYYYNKDEPFVSDEAIVDYIKNAHKELTDKGNITTKDKRVYDTRIHIDYKLKNGKTMSRAYKVSNLTNYNIMADIYKFDEYVKANEGIFRDDELVEISFSRFGIEITDKAKIKEFVECLKKDTLNLEYKEQHIDYKHWEIPTELMYAMPMENNPAVQATQIADVTEYRPYTRVDYDHVSINANHTNTLNWLKENGYGDMLTLNINTPIYIVDLDNITSEELVKESLSYFADKGASRTDISDKEIINKIADIIVTTKMVNSAEHTYNYVIYRQSDAEDSAPIAITKADEATVQKILSLMGD